MHSQLVVLGGGPGGYAAAFLAADEGMEVTIVEAEKRLGGTCLLRGCIPSKALLHVARVVEETRELTHDWGVEFGEPTITREKLLERKNKVISDLTGGLGQLAKQRKVKVITARGSFENSTTLKLEGDHDSIPEGGKLTFDHCVLATGSVPAMPKMFQIGSDRVLDSTGALDLPDLSPGMKMLVIGGGYIGLEMGTVYATLGAEVSVVEMLDGILMGADRDLAKPLERKLQKLFEKRIYLQTQVKALEAKGDGVEVTFEGDKKSGKETFDYVLVSVGRRPVSEGIGLENTGVEIIERGFVKVDSQLKTDDDRIYAIGDVAGEPMFAHKATHEGRIAVEAILGRPTEWDKIAVPAVVFTDPEVAWAGVTENDAKASGREVKVVTYPWAASGRARAIGRTEGLTKWVLDPETDRVIGCGMVGPGAGELIAEAVLAIEMGCEAHDITDSIHPHPTLSETVMNAAEVYFGTATEIYKPRRD